MSTVQLGAFEILEKASAIKDRTKRIEYLREAAVPPLQVFLQYALDPNVTWLVSSEMPVFTSKDNPDGLETQFLSEIRRLYIFVDRFDGKINHKVDITDAKRNVLWLQLLTMLHMKDVELLLCAVEKRLPYDGLERDVIKEAFPHLLPDLTEKDVEKDKEDTVVRTETTRIKKVKTTTPRKKKEKTTETTP